MTSIAAPAADSRTELRRAALIYAREGWPVFPCQPGGKRPATEHGFRDASTDPEFIAFCWRPGGPAYNVAIATGAPGPDVLDVDSKPGEDGWQAYERLKDAGLLAGALALVRTRSGGLHVYFRGTGQRNAARIGRHAVDFRGAGGYVLAAPSAVTADDGSSGCYAFTDYRPGACGTFSLDAARELLMPPRARPAQRRKGGKDITALVRFIEHGPDGFDGHKRLYWAACRVTEQGQAGRLGELITAAVAAGLDETEARRCAANAEKRAAADG